jgi:regulator of sigma E protease
MTLVTILSVAVALGVMILVHEWGHFAAAKAFGVRVEIFSIGFGPRIWGRKRGETDYRVSALPLGGYVKMAGDNPAEERTNDPAEFLAKPRWQRAIIILAGPVMNVVMAVALMAILLMSGVARPAYEDEPAVIGGVVEGSPAAEAGIQPGDRIVKIGGVRNPTWSQALLELQLSAVTGKVQLAVERAGQKIPVTIPLKVLESLSSGFEAIGFPNVPVTIDRLAAGLPAEKAGLKPGDVILAINGQPMNHQIEARDQVQKSKGAALNVRVRRGGEELTLQMSPVLRDPANPDAGWQIGAYFGEATALRSYGPIEAVQRSVWFNLRVTTQILNVVVQLFRGGVSIKQLAGPVGIVRESSAAIQLGASAFLLQMTIISLNLGVLNLLPIPILDGGHIVLLAIEGTIRRDLSLRLKERFVQVGLVFLLVVFAIVMYNDILKALPGR